MKYVSDDLSLLLDIISSTLPQFLYNKFLEAKY